MGERDLRHTPPRTILPLLIVMQTGLRSRVHQRTHNRLRHVLPALLAIACNASIAEAQRMVTAQVGVGAAIDKRNDRLDGSHRHAAIAVEVTPPLVPLGLRGDAMWIDTGSSGGSAAVTVNGVFTLRLPFVRPYAMAGWGQYGVGESTPRSGANVGVGVRILAGPLRLFGEARRHWALSRDLVTVGISL